MLDLLLGNGSWRNTNGWIKNKTNNSSLEVGRVRDYKVRTPSEVRAVIYLAVTNGGKNEIFTLTEDI